MQGQFGEQAVAGDCPHHPPQHGSSSSLSFSYANIATLCSHAYLLSQIMEISILNLCISAKLSFADGSHPFPHSSTSLLRLNRAWEEDNASLLQGLIAQKW